MKLVIITTPDFFVVEHLIINALFDEGLDALHLRKPDSSAVLFERLISLIKEEYRKRIVIHDHFHLKKKYGLGGIHLNSRNPQLPDNYHGNVTCSCHSLEEVEQYKKKMKYVFLSPIFDSLSKVGYESQFSLDTLEKASRQGIIDEKVIALGGLSRQTIPTIRTIPFGGYALLGAIWGKTPETLSKDELLRRYKSIQDETRDNIS